MGYIIQIQDGKKELWPRHGFFVCMHLDLGDMTLSKGHGTPLAMDNNCVK